MTVRYTVSVDEQRCAATGFCVRVASEIFELSDSTGNAVVKAPITDTDLQEKAEEAEITCPTGAISLLVADHGDR